MNAATVSLLRLLGWLFLAAILLVAAERIASKKGNLPASRTKPIFRWLGRAVGLIVALTLYALCAVIFWTKP